MILVIFAAFVSSIIPEKYSKIANIAKKKSYLRVKENMEEEIMLPGKYQDGAISFDVKKPLTSTDYQGIKGFAIDMELEAIAIVSNNDFIENVKNGATLSDKETSTLYQLEEELGNDDDVTVYKIRQTNLFSVLSNIKIAYNSRRNFENDLDGDVQGICQNISSDEEKFNLFYNVGYSKKIKL